MDSQANSTGLRYWMERVLDECENVSSDFSADPVHDLRVALRRCRSMADGMMAMDPDPEWKDMKKAGKQLFRSLGDLRDVQVMMDWTDKLSEKLPVAAAPAVAEQAPATPAADDAAHADDPAAKALIRILEARETEHKRNARAALAGFDRKQWKQWSKSLPRRAARIRPGSAVFKHLALERWTSARELQTRALRNRSQVALHTLRIGIKRFRYIVENFLPAEHKAWSNDLKALQDLLGEVHDLDVLWTTAVSCKVFPDITSRNMWHALILKERAERVEQYRRKAVGPESLWNTWRVGLPQGKQVAEIATRRMKLWARALDPDFAHSEHVARLALQLYDGLADIGFVAASSPSAARQKNRNGEAADERSSLYAAALLHDVGKSKGQKGHHKESLELIKKHGTPAGWKEEAMRRAAIVARFHTGALPVRSHKNLRDLLPDDQKIVIRLSAILRLANALDAGHDGHIRRLKVEAASADSTHRQRANGFVRKPAALAKNEPVIICAEGYANGTPTAQTVAAERYLLETVLRHPVMVKPMKALTV